MVQTHNHLIDILDQFLHCFIDISSQQCTQAPFLLPVCRNVIIAVVLWAFINKYLNRNPPPPHVASDNLSEHQVNEVINQ